MTAASGDQDALNAWIAAVDRRHRSRRRVAASLKDDRAGVRSIVLRFALKVAEIGPASAVKLALAVVASRLGRR